jgi:hypothetical protein
LSTSSSDWPAKKKSTGRQQATWRKMDGCWWWLAAGRGLFCYLWALGRRAGDSRTLISIGYFFPQSTRNSQIIIGEPFYCRTANGHTKATLWWRGVREKGKPPKIQKPQNIHGRKSSTTDRECQMNWRHSTCKTEANEICLMFSNRNCGAKVVFVDVSRG